MIGRITPKSDDELDTIGDLFTRYLQAENISLTAQGDTVMPDGSTQIGWLSDAFKTLELEVTLQGESFDVRSPSHLHSYTTDALADHPIHQH